MYAHVQVSPVSNSVLGFRVTASSAGIQVHMNIHLFRSDTIELITKLKSWNLSFQLLMLPVVDHFMTHNCKWPVRQPWRLKKVVLEQIVVFITHLYVDMNNKYTFIVYNGPSTFAPRVLETRGWSRASCRSSDRFCSTPKCR